MQAHHKPYLELSNRCLTLSQIPDAYSAEDYREAARVIHSLVGEANRLWDMLRYYEHKIIAKDADRVVTFTRNFTQEDAANDF